MGDATDVARKACLDAVCSIPDDHIFPRRSALLIARSALKDTGAHEFAELCAEQGLEHRLTPPASTRTNGMVERFHGRIEEVLQSRHVRSGEDLETTLHRTVRLYNQQLPQSALGGTSPLQAVKDWPKLKPHCSESHTASRDVTPIRARLVPSHRAVFPDRTGRAQQTSVRTALGRQVAAAHGRTMATADLAPPMPPVT